VQHTYIHSGDKPFPCDVCKKSFRQRSTLVEHTRTHSADKTLTSEMFHHNSSVNQYGQ
jgi:uncharacterized Zn-finger protein